MKFRSDIDIDFGDRQQILNLVPHTDAVIVRNGEMTRHNTGVYFTDIPHNPVSRTSTIDYREAEDRGYIKLDFLNVGVYSQVKNEQHLEELMRREPAWDRLYEPEFCQQVIHIGNHYDTLIRMPEAVNSIPRMAMFLAVMRPAKRYLIGETWSTVTKTVWDRPSDDVYYFKKAHGVAYAHLVVVHMNLLSDLSN